MARRKAKVGVDDSGVFSAPRTAYSSEKQIRYWAEHVDDMKDPYWRLHHIYHVKDLTGKVIPFRPNPEQSALYHAIFRDGIRNVLIIKARQLGMSTAIEMLIVDQQAFGQGVQSAIVDQTQGDASKKLNNKIKLAWEYLPREFRDSFTLIKDNDSQFSVKLKGYPELNEVQAGMTARGDTFQILHISEWGPIQALDAARSEEILTGAIPAAKDGIRIIETTWKGGKHGHLWGLAKAAMETPDEDLTREDFKLFFFPWYNDKQYSTEGRLDQLGEDMVEYFKVMEKETGHEFTPGQKLWYFKKALPMGTHRFQEFPTTLEEAFTGANEGVILHECVMQARLQKRVFNFRHDPSELVHTFWDLGAPLNMCTWYAQFIGREIHLIDVDMEIDLDLVDRVGRMMQKPYAFGAHYLPHDAKSAEKSGRNFVEQLAKHLGNLRVIPRTSDVFVGIDHLKTLFPTMYFNKQFTETALERLEGYRTKVDRTTTYVTETIVHDACSHVADALRMLAEAHLNSMLGPNLLSSNKTLNRVKRKNMRRTAIMR
jgi:hypothetical protein